ncbi:MAG: hypothetical protein P8Y70_07705 [Candidatus Lokiarchaeota archaeon]
MNFKDMPKICIKCKKREEDGTKIQKFVYSRTNTRGIFRNYKDSKTFTISFPVCSSCAIDFKKYKMFVSIYDALRKYLIIISIVLWGLIISQLIYQSWNPVNNINTLNFYNIILWIFALIIPLIYASLYFIIKKHPNRISKYVTMKLNGKVTIHDKELEEEMLKKAEKDITEFENNINVIFCPNCGEKFPKETDFCLSCGKDLRVI